MSRELHVNNRIVVLTVASLAAFAYHAARGNDVSKLKFRS